jgi:hypothetical protein
LHDQTGFERRRLYLRARRRAFDSGHGFLDHEIDGLRELDADRLRLVEFHADDRVGNEVVLRVAQRLVRDVNLLEAGRVHEIEMVRVVVEVLHLALVKRGAFDVLFRAELVVGQGQRPDVAHPTLDVGALVAGREMVEIEDAE